jgi:hypothetical protein
VNNKPKNYKHMKKLITIIALVSVVSFVNAEKKSNEAKETASVAPVTLATITGKVFDKQTGETLTGVCVQIEELGLTTYTDFDGNFTVPNVKPGSYTVKTKMISYCEVTQKKLNVNTNEVHALNLGLSPLSE